MNSSSEIIAWSDSWAWGVPLIILTVSIHVSGLWVFFSLTPRLRRHIFLMAQPSYWAFLTIIGLATLFMTMLHGIEAIVWAGAYIALGAMSDIRSALLYSLNAITTFGHFEADLAFHWRMLGALEALNGLLLFGVTSAYLFAIVQRVLTERMDAEKRR